MRSIIILLSAMAISLATQAQSKKAEDILRKVSETTKSYRSLKISFNYEMINEEADIHEEERGVLIVSGDKYRLSIAGQVVINNGETMWTYLKDANEVQINDVEEEDDGMITPTKLLTEYADDFKPKLTGEQLWKNTKIWLIELKPKGDKPYEKVELKIDQDEERILEIAIFDQNGNIFKYSLNEYKPNVLFDPGDFTFEPEEHPGVELIDMRL